MRTETINPENWVSDEVEVEVNDPGTRFTIYGHRFRVERRMWVETETMNIRTDYEDAADLIEYEVFSDDGSWSDDEPMVYGSYWPSVYRHERVVMVREGGMYEREADTAWEAAAKVLANII